MEQAVDDLENESVINTNITSVIQQLAAVATRSNCEYLNIERVERLINASTRRAGRLVHDRALYDLLMARAQLADQREDYQAAITALEELMKNEPALDAALLIAYFHVESGDIPLAIAHLEDLVESPPVGFPESLVWKNRLGELLESLKPSAEKTKRQ